MRLDQASAQKFRESPITDISSGVIYYVHTGRNAWHSTWITRYSNGCMHTTMESATDYAEGMRTKGTVFYIKQLPCLVFRTKNWSLLVTEINSRNPLAGYSPDATSKEAPSGATKIDGAIDNYMAIGAPLNGVALSFMPDSRFWNVRPSPKNSVILLSCFDSGLQVEALPSGGLKAFKSISNGGNYYLGWAKKEPDVKSVGVLNLSKKVQPNQ